MTERVTSFLLFVSVALFSLSCKDVQPSSNEFSVTVQVQKGNTLGKASNLPMRMPLVDDPQNSVRSPTQIRAFLRTVGPDNTGELISEEIVAFSRPLTTLTLKGTLEKVNEMSLVLLFVIDAGVYDGDLGEQENIFYFYEATGLNIKAGKFTWNDEVIETLVVDSTELKVFNGARESHRSVMLKSDPSYRYYQNSTNWETLIQGYVDYYDLAHRFEVWTRIPPGGYVEGESQYGTEALVNAFAIEQTTVSYSAVNEILSEDFFYTRYPQYFTLAGVDGTIDGYIAVAESGPPLNLAINGLIGSEDLNRGTPILLDMHTTLITATCVLYDKELDDEGFQKLYNKVENMYNILLSSADQGSRSREWTVSVGELSAYASWQIMAYEASRGDQAAKLINHDRLYALVLQTGSHFSSSMQYYFRKDHSPADLTIIVTDENGIPMHIGDINQITNAASSSVNVEAFLNYIENFPDP